MIGRKSTRKSEEAQEVERPKGFDDFDLSLGDIMRGERATLGKSLLDVQRELRIKAAYIAAIENCDPSAFDTPGFIAGYVRSYARYLGMEPDEAFATFCTESGFSVAHGMSAEASVVRKSGKGLGEGLPTASGGLRDPFKTPNTPFAPAGDSLFSHVEPRAIGSMLVLLALIGGIGYGAWSVLKEVQQVQFAPVDQAPTVLSDLDPLENARRTQAGRAPSAPSSEALDRLYRPQALDVPVLVARDAPISTLSPGGLGSFAGSSLPETPRAQLGVPSSDIALATRSVTRPASPNTPSPAVPQVVEAPGPALQVVAVRTSWVRVSSADGTVIFEKTMQPGDTWVAPKTEEPPLLRTGESGAVYFAMEGTFYGPVGPSGAVTSNVALSIAKLKETYAPAEIGADAALVRYAEARGRRTIEPAAD